MIPVFSCIFARTPGCNTEMDLLQFYIKTTVSIQRKMKVKSKSERPGFNKSNVELG
jgi:hypothetical protein